MTDLYLSPTLSGPATPSSSSSAPSPQSTVEDLIHDRIAAAILAGRLEPGTKLPEEEIAAAFQVSRALVRKVLVIMEREGIVTLRHNCGAYITVPSQQTAHDTFEVLRLLGGQAVRGLSRSSDPDVHDQLQRHYAAQQEADASNPATSQHLAVEFLVLLAHLHGNRALAEILRCHVVLLRLTLMTYQDATRPPAYPVDQQAILTAIAAGDTDKAETALDLSLSRIEQCLTFFGDGHNGSKLKSILMANTNDGAWSGQGDERARCS